MDTGELYALPPEQFTAARDAAAKQAKADGDQEAAAALKALRRPSVAAWLVNRLSAGDAELLEQLLSLGPALAQAQAGGHADELRALGSQRRQLVEAVADGAVATAARKVGATVRDEVVSTLEAALADPGSADAVRSGRLVRALSYAGFGEVDLSGAVAAPARPPPRTGARRKAHGKAPAADSARAQEAAAAHRREQVAQAERRALVAAGGLDDAVRAAERADREAAASAAAVEQADAELHRAAAALERATRAREAAATASSRSAELAEQARAAVGPAHEAAEQARRRLDELRRNAGP